MLTANDKELRIELKRRISDRLHTSLMGANQADPVRYSSGGYKARHYNKRFGAELGADWTHKPNLLKSKHNHLAHSTGLCMLRTSMKLQGTALQQALWRRAWCGLDFQIASVGLEACSCDVSDKAVHAMQGHMSPSCNQCRVA